MCPFVRPTVHHAFSQMPARRIFCHVSGLVTSVISLRRLSRSQTASPRFRCHGHLHMIVFPSNCQAVIIFVTPDCRINLFSRIFPTPLELKWNCCTFWNKIDFAPQNWMIYRVEVPNQKVCAALLLYRGLQIGIVWLASTLCCWLDQTERVFRPQIPIRKFWDSGSLAISIVLCKKSGNKSEQF